MEGVSPKAASSSIPTRSYADALGGVNRIPPSTGRQHPRGRSRLSSSEAVDACDGATNQQHHHHHHKRDRSVGSKGSSGNGGDGSSVGGGDRNPKRNKMGRTEPGNGIDSGNGSNPQPMDLDTQLFRKLDPSDPVQARRIFQRRKDVSRGKNTAGYAEYTRQVPREWRRPRSMQTPSTPDPTLDVSAKRWQGMIRAWRVSLHNYDPPDLVSAFNDSVLSQDDCDGSSSGVLDGSSASVAGSSDNAVNTSAATYASVVAAKKSESSAEATATSTTATTTPIQVRQLEKAAAEGLLVDISPLETPSQKKQNRSMSYAAAAAAAAEGGKGEEEEIADDVDDNDAGSPLSVFSEDSPQKRNPHRQLDELFGDTGGASGGTGGDAASGGVGVGGVQQRPRWGDESDSDDDLL